MDKNNAHYSFVEFLRVFKFTNLKTWWSVVMIIPGAFAVLNLKGNFIPQYFFPYFLSATIFSAPIFLLIKANGTLFNLYKEVEEVGNSSSTDSIARIFGYKRLLWRRDIIVRGDGIIESSNKFIIKASHELRQIALFWSSYPGIGNKVIAESEKRFVTFEDYSRQGLGNVETDVASDGTGKLYYLVKFDRNLKSTDPPITLKTKIEFPESALNPDQIYKKIIAENGKMIGIMASVPTDRIEMKITLPKEKQYQPLDCLGGCFCSMSRIGSDVERAPAIKCEESANEFEFPVVHPVINMIYLFCWKEKKT